MNNAGILGAIADFDALGAAGFGTVSLYMQSSAYIFYCRNISFNDKEPHLIRQHYVPV